jgi:pimeloyl-ACP methyl ester carboxylesterase
VNRLVARVGYFRVAAVLIGCALVLEIFRNRAFAPGSSGRVACTWGEIAFFAAAALPFLAGRARAQTVVGSRSMRLHHDSWGDGPALVLLHAGICDSRMWQPNLARLGAGRRLITYDMRGCGRSSWQAGGAFSHVDDLVALLDYLAIERAALVGASQGARVALEAALEHPGRVGALCLVAPGIRAWDWSQQIAAYNEREDVLLQEGDLEGVVELNLRTWVDGPSRDPDVVDPAVRALVGQMQRRIVDLWLEASAMAGEPGPERPLDPPARERLQEIAVPALVVLGSVDQPDIGRIGALLGAEIPGARSVTIDGVAHLPSLEQPDAFDELVDSFLSNLAG